jgi:hypothetical protein
MTEKAPPLSAPSLWLVVEAVITWLITWRPRPADFHLQVVSV